MAVSTQPPEPALPRIFGNIAQYRRTLQRQIEDADHLLARLPLVEARIDEYKTKGAWLSVELEEVQWTDMVERWRDRVSKTSRQYLDKAAEDILPATTQDWPPNTGKPRHARHTTWVGPWLSDSRNELKELRDRLAGPRPPSDAVRTPEFPPPEKRDFRYDVALSFAGEQREYVEAVADALQRSGISVFYDAYETIDLWGKDLYAHLADVYGNQARHVVLFASAEYAEKAWTNLERTHTQATALTAKYDYLLPARFDDTEIPGLAKTVGYVDLRTTSALDFAGMVVQKVRR